MGLPPPSARRCSLVENPPWLRPSASALSWPPMTPGGRRAAGAGGVLMGANYGRIDEVQVPIDGPARIGRRLQTGQHTLPNPATAPTIEPARHRPDRPIAPRQIAPRRTGTVDPQNAIQNAPVVLIGTARARSLGRQQGCQALPLRVRQITSSHSTQVRAHKRNINPLQTRPRPTAVSRSVRRAVLRAQGAAMPGRRSVKTRRSHRTLSQNIRRTRSRTATACSPQGRSASLRSYRLWVRRARRPHSGHAVGRGREVRVRVIAGGAGSRPQVSSRTEAGSGNKQGRRFTRSIWRYRSNHQKWPRALM
jgi:hypothetical protein